jgi:hypothetical protein
VPRMSKIELFAAIRRDLAAGMSGRAIEEKYRVGRRTDSAATASALPPPRKAMPPRGSKLDPFKPTIDEILRADLDAPRKQRHTVRRIYHRLLDEHGMADVSYQVVRTYIADRKPKIRAEAGRGPIKVFFPQAHRPGAEAEVDFGEVVIKLRGEPWVLPPAAAAKLEALWAEHLALVVPAPPRSTPRQGWQMDPARRKKVEDAAQSRLMEHFRKDGWTVHDVRYGNPYDAIATKAGRTLWLEAKGTETSGTSVIVTPNEVTWAQQHPGDCVLGVLSDVRFLPNGELETSSGTFRIFAWNPHREALKPRAYDFTPTATDSPTCTEDHTP